MYLCNPNTYINYHCNTMKKTIVIAMLMAAVASASAQWFDFSNNKNRFDLGVNLGMTGLKCNYQAFTWGASLNVYGVYVDFLYGAPAHKYDNHVVPVMYNDTSITSINIGYQIPVLPWLRVMPIVGHCHTNAGLTDATTVNVEVTDDYSAEMYHDFNVTSRRHYFNYGCGLIIQPIRWFNLYAVYSRQAVYGGLGISLGDVDW